MSPEEEARRQHERDGAVPPSAPPQPAPRHAHPRLVLGVGNPWRQVKNQASIPGCEEEEGGQRREKGVTRRREGAPG